MMKVRGFLHMFCLPALALGIALCLLASDAKAIEVTCLGKRPVTYDFGPWGTRDMTVIGVKGSFVSGDFEKFKARFAALKATPGGCYTESHKYNNQTGDGYLLELDSQGGSFVEAIRLASHVTEYSFGTYVGPNKDCLSACALVFMAGKQHLGDGDQSDGKIMHYTARIGLHSPFLPATDMSGLPLDVLRDVLNTTYSEAIQAASELTVLAIQAGWEPGFVNLVLKTPSDQFMYIDTFGKVGDWNIQLEGVAAPKPTSVEELTIACVNYIFWGKQDAGLALDIAVPFDPNLPLAPTLKDYEHYNSGNEFIVIREKRTDNQPGERLSFTSDWYGEFCSFNISPDGAVAGEQAWNRPFKNIDIIPSYTRLDSIAGAEPTSAVTSGQLTLDQAINARLWDHNGSTMRSFMRPDGSFEIVYHVPRPGLESIGVVAGTPLITAWVNGQGIEATAWLFGSNGCGAVQYNVAGNLSDLAGAQMVLHGAAPKRDAACNIIGSDARGANANLLFTRLQ
ncbi:MAG: hypothetical protein ACSHXB_02950 [Sulfitobacter sp.]